mmetsp:Transcript_157/g.366  ORF Transcript_157/g.366 Transcript_157/m.366 type:complete len:262 (-) Transcript_157:1309-2094(-)
MVFLFHPVGRKFGHSQINCEGLQPESSLLGGSGRVVCDHLCNFIEFRQHREAFRVALRPCLQGLDISGKAEGEEGSADSAMGGRVETSKDPRKPMHSSELRIGQTEPSNNAGHCQVFPCSEVRPVSVHSPKRPSSPLDSLSCEGIGHWVGVAAHEGLDALSERVKARVCRDVWRHGDGQLRVDDGQVGEHVVGPNRDLPSVLLALQHRVLRHFGARPCGCWQREEGNRRIRQHLALSDHFCVVHGVASVAQQRRDGLSHVD